MDSMQCFSGSQIRSAATRLGQQLAGPIITLATASGLELLRHFDIILTNPGVPLTLTIVLSFFLSGSVPGIASAVLAWLYNSYYFSLPGRPFEFTDDNFERVVISGLAIPPLAVMLCFLKYRADQSAERKAIAARLEAQLEEQSRSEAKIRAAEAAGWETARFLRTIIAAEPECVKLVAPDGVLLDMNPAGLAMLDCETLAQAQSVPLWQFVVEEHRAAFAELHERVMRGESGTLEFETVGRRGTRRCVETHAVPLRDQRDQITALLGITRNITDRKRAERRERNHQEILEQLAKGQALPVVLESVVALVEQRSPDSLCSILLLDQAGRHLMHGAAPRLPDFYNQAIHGVEIGPAVGSCGTAAFTGQRVIVEDVETHPYWAAYRDLAKKAGLRSCWSEPIIATTHEVLGTFAIYHATPRAPTPEELDFISIAAHLASIAIERTRTDEAMRKSEEFFRLVWENSADGMRLTDEGGTIVRVNQAFCRMMGQSRESIEGKPLAVIYALNRQDHIARMHRERFASRTIQPYLETEVTLRAGENKWFAVANSLIELEGSPPMLLGIFRDITERKRAENQLFEYAARLRSLSAQTLTAQENERRHIARELHDEVGQVLTAVAINLHAVRVSAGSSAWPVVDESLGVVNQAIEQVRNMSLDLRPSMLDDLGLEAALRWHLDRQAQRSGFDVQFVSDLADRRPPPEIETVCFRVAQEALTNITRHAHATHVSIELLRCESELQLIIEDNGSGFDMKSVRLRADRGHTFGLSGMHERVELAGGKIAVHSEPGRGTRICASFANRSAESSGVGGPDDENDPNIIGRRS
jgi:PAS domain S-box-containing protein